MKRLTLLLLIIACAAAASGQYDKAKDRGFNAEAVYQLNEFDAVNAFNGNAVVTVPLGQEYRSNGTLAYRFNAVYNSQFWDYWQHGDPSPVTQRWRVAGHGGAGVWSWSNMVQLSPYPPGSPRGEELGAQWPGVESYPAETMNAGLGWTVSLGELQGGVTYVGPEGDRHEFYLNFRGYPATRCANATDPIASGCHPASSLVTSLYTRDGSFLRLDKVAAPAGVTARVVRFPDGISRRFECYDSNCTDIEFSRWLLTEIRDPYGNRLEITRSTPGYPRTEGLWTWVLVEKTPDGEEVRRHELEFSVLFRPECARQEGRYEVRLSRARVAKFNGGFADYGFQYDGGDIFRDHNTGWNDDPGSYLRAPFNCAGKVDVSFLRSIDLPDNAGKWSFAYERYTGNESAPFGVGYGPTGDGRNLPVLGQHFVTSDRDGYLSKVDAPTGASVTYQYEPRAVPSRTDCSVPDPMSVRPLHAVKKRSVSVDGRTHHWHYLSHVARDPVPGTTCGIQTAVVSAIVDPEQTVTVSYQSVYRGGPSGGWNSLEYGLPITHAADDAAGRQLSTEIYKCTQLGEPGTWAADPRQLVTTPGCQALRRTYKKYQWNAEECPTASIHCVGSDRRVISEATVYADDGGAYAATEYSGYDGLGHFRETRTGGNLFSKTFGGGGDVRLTTRNYNPGSSYSESTDLVTNVPSSWIFSTYDFESVRQARNNADAPSTVTAAKEFDFETSTGRLRRVRTYAKLDGQRDGSDVVVEYLRSRVDRERVKIVESYSGGDGAGIATGTALPALSLTPSYSIQKILRAGGIESERYVGCSTDGELLIAGRVIDRHTGLASSTADAAEAEAGKSTLIRYDALGRITVITPPGQSLSPIVYNYVKRESGGNSADDSKFARVEMDHASGSGLALREQSVWRYDGLGRLAVALVAGPESADTSPASAGDWRRTAYRYDALGRRSETSATHAANAPEPSVMRYTYDPFGRVLTARRLLVTGTGETRTETEEASTTYDYDGVRVTTVSADNRAPKTLYHDRFGRLVKVVEAAAAASVRYEYDVMDHLTGVFRAGQELSASPRIEFAFDGRGFQYKESYPEYDTPRWFGRFDARGHARSVTPPGGGVLTYEYDFAERLQKIRSASGQELKTFSYYPGNGAGLSKGKLWTASRLNSVRPAVGAAPANYRVDRTYTYDGVHGAVKQITTAGTDLGGNCGAACAFSATVQYDHDALGNVATLWYPDAGTCVPACRRQATFTRKRGVVSQIDSSVPGSPADTPLAELFYHPNGLVDRLRRLNGLVDKTVIGENGLPRPDVIRVRDRDTDAVVWTHQLGYNRAGDVTSLTNSTVGGGLTTATYLYDDAGRLTEARLPGNTRLYGYDAWGNLTRLDEGGEDVCPGNTTCMEARNRIVKAGYEYDGAGNLIARPDVRFGGSFEYGWDAFNAMTHSRTTGAGQPSFVYLYDAGEERVATVERRNSATGTLPVVKERWSVRGADNRVLSEFDRIQLQRLVRRRDAVWGPQAIVAEYVTPANDGPQAVRHLHTDHLGSVRLLTDGSGTPIGLPRTFRPFGSEPLAHEPEQSRFRFTGHERDDDGLDGSLGDLDYMHARYYSPTMGRFLSTDPDGYDPKRPQSWNRYTYVLNQPLSLTDPSGRCVWDICVAEATAVAAAATAITAWAVAPSPVDSKKTNAQVAAQQITDGVVALVALTKKLTPYAPDRRLPTDPRTGNPVIDDGVVGPHTQLGRRTGRERAYPRGREFDEQGKRVRDIDFTDHGRPKTHTDPHEHPYDPTTGERLPAQPLRPDGTRPTNDRPPRE